MSLPRLIPRLDIKGPNLVKGIHLEGLRVLGKPEYFARRYYAQGADELLFMDVVASLYGRNSLLDIIERTAREIFIPLTVGGGIRSLEDIQAALRAGADKVALNTAALRRPELIREAAQRFGSSTIVVSIEAIRHLDGSYEAYTDNGRESTGVSALEWAIRAEALGAGELLVTSIDREGTGKGFDLELTRRIAESVSIPVIACGGAGRKEHLAEALELGKANAVCVASLLHYECAAELARDAEFAGEGNTEYLRNGKPPAFIAPVSLTEVKLRAEPSPPAHLSHAAGEGEKFLFTALADVAREKFDSALVTEEERKKRQATPVRPTPFVAIVDYGMGNLFSVQRACEQVGLRAEIVSERKIIEQADAVLLPGVGAFGDAMATLHRRDLARPLQDFAQSGKPFFGVCLGVQLLLTESYEFGRHKGLDIIPGEVVRLEHPKVPHIGWNRIFSPERAWSIEAERNGSLSPLQGGKMNFSPSPAAWERGAGGEGSPWMNTPLEACEEGAYQYFVHSYIAQPEETNVVLSVTRYGDIAFCSSLQRDNLFACQFHPERSGAAGLAIYRALAKRAQLNLSELSELPERAEEKTIGSKVRAA